MKTENRIQLLEDAQDLMIEAVKMIEDALQGTEHEAHADAYIISHLNNWINSHGYDMGVEQYIEEIAKDEENEKR